MSDGGLSQHEAQFVPEVKLGGQTWQQAKAKSYTLLILKSVKHTEIRSQMQADTCI